MHEVRTEIEINASAERVWSVLTDFPSHPDWNPFVRSIQGKAEKGERLRVSIQPPGSRSMTFQPTVLTAIRPQELRWLGHFLFSGLFDGEHYFQIMPLGEDRVRFIQGERFSGIMVFLAKASLEGATKSGFIAMNEALKTRAEQPLA